MFIVLYVVFKILLRFWYKIEVWKTVTFFNGVMARQFSSTENLAHYWCNNITWWFAWRDWWFHKHWRPYQSPPAWFYRLISGPNPSNQWYSSRVGNPGFWLQCPSSRLILSLCNTQCKIQMTIRLHRKLTQGDTLASWHKLETIMLMLG